MTEKFAAAAAPVTEKIPVPPKASPITVSAERKKRKLAVAELHSGGKHLFLTPQDSLPRPGKTAAQQWGAREGQVLKNGSQRDTSRNLTPNLWSRATGRSTLSNCA